jgi:hypothetical protein
MGGEEIPWTSIATVFGILQIQTTYGGHLFMKYFHNTDWILGKGNRLKLWELIAVVIGFSIDDVGTAIGQQAYEEPRQLYEGNPHMGAIWEWLIASGFATSTTDAHRIIYIIFMVQLFVNQYFGLMNSYGRLFYLYNSAAKTYAGYNWWSLKPNDYTILDFIFFKSGQPRLERMAYGKVFEYNRMVAFVEAQSRMRGISLRRRMFPTKDYVDPKEIVVTPPPIQPGEWLIKVLPIFFGSV